VLLDFVEYPFLTRASVHDSTAAQQQTQRFQLVPSAGAPSIDGQHHKSLEHGLMISWSRPSFYSGSACRCSPDETSRLLSRQSTEERNLRYLGLPTYDCLIARHQDEYSKTESSMRIATATIRCNIDRPRSTPLCSRPRSALMRISSQRQTAISTGMAEVLNGWAGKYPQYRQRTLRIPMQPNDSDQGPEQQGLKYEKVSRT
jgi:hypothetical protein